MAINKVPSIDFAQIANSALRDKRLSFKARGVLAMVLSNVGEWDAPRDWLEEMSDSDGRHAIQGALNELTELGYREVKQFRNAKGQLRTETHWHHVPVSQENRQSSFPAGGSTVPPSEDHLQNTIPEHQSSQAADDVVHSTIPTELREWAKMHAPLADIDRETSWFRNNVPVKQQTVGKWKEALLRAHQFNAKKKQIEAEKANPAIARDREVQKSIERLRNRKSS